MKTKDILNINNIKNFITGNLLFLKKQTIGLPKHIEEQVSWRLSLCYSDCIKDSKCKYCGCPPEKKLLLNKSCNNGERFPDMMNEKMWNEYKIEHKIL